MLFRHSLVGAQLGKTSQTWMALQVVSTTATFAPPLICLVPIGNIDSREITSHPTEMDIFWKTGSFKTSGQFPVYISVETCYEKLITFENQGTRWNTLSIRLLFRDHLISLLIQRLSSTLPFFSAVLFSPLPSHLSKLKGNSWARPSCTKDWCSAVRILGGWFSQG